MTNDEATRADLIEYLRQMAEGASVLADRLGRADLVRPTVAVQLGGSVRPEGNLTIVKTGDVHGMIESSAVVVERVDHAPLVDPKLARRVAKWAALSGTGFVANAVFTEPKGALEEAIASVSADVWHDLAELARIVAEYLAQ